MFKIASLFIISLCAVSSTSCKSNNRNSNLQKTRQEMNSAKTADDWISRFQLDLQDSYFLYDKLARNYSELPAQAEWSAITDKLDEVTKDNSKFTEFINKNNDFGGSNDEANRLNIQLFSKLLNDDLTNAETVYRSVILLQKKSGSIGSYNHSDLLNNLLLLSDDSEKSIEWFNKNVAKEKSDHSSHYTKSETPAWRKALAENHIDEGIKLLLKAIKAAPNDDKIELISNLARLAHLLDKPELGEQAMTMFEKEMIKQYKTSDYISYYDYDHSLNYYVHQKQWEKLYDLCKKINDTKPVDKYSSSNGLVAYQLTALYHLGKMDDFENELTSALKKHTQQPRSYFDLLEQNAANEAPIGALYIDLLAAKGDQQNKELAYKISTHLLARNQGKDVYYKRTIALNPDAAARFIASLREYDPYEERPLIWQSEMALQAGELDKARQLIEQAIALDPSDGDHGKFTRMHCYDVLSRICQKQGDTEKAKFLQEVVIAIREGEAADDYLYAGLIKEATDRYKKALGHFNDAYCLQSRLAKTLMEAGKFDEAIPHFKKAFELMPVSFGPRESHCFGCEGLFDDERVQNLAIPTLNAFLEKEPENPRTPYLLGLVFVEMKKNTEAITAFEKALELDPHYYNAASRLYNIISTDPTKHQRTVTLRKQLFEIAPYENKPDYMPNPHLLKSYWLAAQTFPPSPLKLSPINEIGLKPKAVVHNEQFEEVSANGFSYSLYSHYDSDAALDGWSQKELLLRNTFLKYGF